MAITRFGDILKTIRETAERELPYIEKKSDVLVYAALYIILEKEPRRDTIFFNRFRYLSPMCDNESDALSRQTAKKLVKYGCPDDFFEHYTFRELDAFLGVFLCTMAGIEYTDEDLTMNCKPGEIMLPDKRLTLTIKAAVDEICLKNTVFFVRPRVFSAFIALYMKLRKLNSTSMATWVLYDTLNFPKDKDMHIDLIYRAIELVEIVYRDGYAEMYSPAVVLWHIFRVLRQAFDTCCKDGWIMDRGDIDYTHNFGEYSCCQRICDDCGGFAGAMGVEQDREGLETDDDDSEFDECFDFSGFDEDDEDDDEEYDDAFDEVFDISDDDDGTLDDVSLGEMFRAE